MAERRINPRPTAADLLRLLAGGPQPAAMLTGRYRSLWLCRRVRALKRKGLIAFNAGRDEYALTAKGRQGGGRWLINGAR